MLTGSAPLSAETQRYIQCVFGVPARTPRLHIMPVCTLRLFSASIGGGAEPDAGWRVGGGRCGRATG